MKGRSATRVGLLCLVSLLLGAQEIAGQEARTGTRGRVLEPWRIPRDSRRFEILNTETLWNVLAIRPGMTVLDIGTGTGQFASAFAQRVQGQGKVYATDINESCVRYVQEQAAKRELKNIVPVLVKRDGLDEFYRSETFDVIAMFHILMDYEKKVDFLSYLRSSLAEDGRLVLMIAKEFPDFSLTDFKDDHERLAQEILSEPPDTPFYRAIRESTRELLRTSRAGGNAEGLVKVIAEDFNAILANAAFGMEFFDGSAFREDVDFTREERNYAEWLTIPNNLQNVALRVPRTTWISGPKIKMVNKLLIVQKYRNFLRDEMLYTSGLSPAGRDAFARAGYALHSEYANLVPFEDVVVFTRGR